jgi:hypothetical protein
LDSKSRVKSVHPNRGNRTYRSRRVISAQNSSYKIQNGKMAEIMLPIYLNLEGVSPAPSEAW